MRYLASRVAIVGSLLYLVLWIGSSLIGVVALAAGSFGIAAALARPAWTIDLPLFGFLGVMIFGLALHFMPLLAGRELRYPQVATAQALLALASVGLSLGVPQLLGVGRGVWLAAAVLFVGLVLVSLRSGPVLPRPGDRVEDLRPVDRCAAAMTRASAVYLLAASIGFVLVSPGGRALVPALASYGGSVTHLFLLGFVTLALAGLAFHLLPRFLEVIPSVRIVRPALVLAIVSPAGLVVTLPFASAPNSLRFVFFGFSLTQGAASVLLAALMLGMARRTRRRRPAIPFFATGFLCLAFGVGMGAVMAAVPGTNLRTSSVHSWISLLGFAGFVIFGMTHEILPPYPRRGLSMWELAARGHAGLATLGLLLVVLSQVLALAGFPRTSAALGIFGFGLLLGMALSYAAGTIQTIRAISPPPETVSSER